MALAKPAALSIEEVAVRGAALANAGQPVPLVALDLIDLVDRSEWRGLAAQGLQRTIHDRLYAERQYAGALPNEADGTDWPGASESDSGSIRHLLPRQSHPAKDFWLLPLSQSYRVEGGRRAVLDFTLADASNAADAYRARAYGNHKVADAFALTAKLLREHKADTVRHLPTPAQQSIAAALR